MEVGQGGIWTRSLVGLGFCVCVCGGVCACVCGFVFCNSTEDRFRF